MVSPCLLVILLWMTFLPAPYHPFCNMCTCGYKYSKLKFKQPLDTHTHTQKSWQTHFFPTDTSPSCCFLVRKIHECHFVAPSLWKNLRAFSETSKELGSQIGWIDLRPAIRWLRLYTRKTGYHTVGPATRNTAARRGWRKHAVSGKLGDQINVW